MSDTPLTEALRDRDMEAAESEVNSVLNDALDSHEQLERELSEANARIEKLEGARRLVTVIFAEDRGDIDGGWLQDKAVKHGVLIEVEATERCVDPDEGSCACAEFGDFPMTCYRVNPALLTKQEKS